MPGCLSESDRNFLIEQILADKVTDDTERAVTILTDVVTCEDIPVAKAPTPKIPPAPEPPTLPTGERAYKTPRHAFMSVCMRGPKKDGCGKSMKECADLFRAGKTEKPC